MKSLSLANSVLFNNSSYSTSGKHLKLGGTRELEGASGGQDVGGMCPEAVGR